MKITKKGEYALRTLLALACVYGERTISLREIAEQEKISYKFLEQIMILLKKMRFVESTQGKFGGYALARSPKEITLGEIIRAVEGPIAPIGTTAEIKRKIQSEEKHRGLYQAFLEVRDAISEILDHKTLADVLEQSLELSRSKSFQMYYI
jgi:Rrf2 family protein